MVQRWTKDWFEIYFDRSWLPMSSISLWGSTGQSRKANSFKASRNEPGFVLENLQNIFHPQRNLIPAVSFIIIISVQNPWGLTIRADQDCHSYDAYWMYWWSNCLIYSFPLTEGVLQLTAACPDIHCLCFGKPTMNQYLQETSCPKL